MQLSQTLLAVALAATSASAAPTSVQSMSVGQEWTVQHAKRSCDEGDNTCTWDWIIDDHAKPIHCNFVTKRYGRTPASRGINQGPQKCGPYVTTSNYSDQFGPGNGFTALAIVDQSRGVKIFPAYNDKELAANAKDGITRSYPVQKL